jgi:hypothetical protein
MDLCQHITAVHSRCTQGMAARQQLAAHIVCSAGCFKTRHALAAVELVLRRVQGMVGTEKSNHLQ